MLIEIYTDGSCKKRKAEQHSFGGWAYLIMKDDKLIARDIGSEQDTTNQRMELLAAIKAIKRAVGLRKHGDTIVVYADSAYLVNCYLDEWWKNWQSNGWLNSSRRPVSNRDLWEELIPFMNLTWLRFSKVKGHENCAFNNATDEMAQDAADKLREDYNKRNEYIGRRTI